MENRMIGSRSSFSPSYQLKLYQFFEKYGSVSLFYRNQLIWGGEDIFLPNIFYIKYGYVKVTSENILKDDPVHAVLGGGDIFSHHVLAGDDNHDLRYMAIDRVKAYAVQLPVLKRSLACDPAFAYSLLDYIIKNSVLHNNAVINLQYNKVSERLIGGLIALGVRFGRKRGDDLVLDRVFNQRLIAGLINSTRETVSREIDKLRRRGLIDTSDGCIVIKDIARLYDEINRRPFKANQYTDS